MKKYILSTAFSLSLLTVAFSTAYAQKADKNDQNPFTTEEVKDVYELKTLNATPANGKVYINWTVTDATGQCVYVVERSSDGITYEKVGTKKGAPSPGSTPLMFSFVDVKPAQGKSYYRVQRVGLNNSAYTQAIAVKNTAETTGNSQVAGLASNK